MFTALDAPVVTDSKARYWSKITILPQLGSPYQNIAITFGMAKPQCIMVWLPDGENF